MDATTLLAIAAVVTAVLTPFSLAAVAYFNSIKRENQAQFSALQKQNTDLLNQNTVTHDLVNGRMAELLRLSREEAIRAQTKATDKAP